MRAGARQLGRRCLDPALPWRVRRTRLDQLTRPFLLPRGTTVTEQKIGGVPAEVVSVGAPGTQPTVVHFHGGGYCIGSARTVRGWAAHLSAHAGCRVGRDRRADPALMRRDVLLSPEWLDACAHAYAAPEAWADASVSRRPTARWPRRPGSSAR
jgi:hypothetical protein